MNEHTVKAFDEELRYVTTTITEMGGHAEAMIGDAVSILLKADTDQASLLIERDLVLDRLQAELDERIVVIIAKRQPMAMDLRALIGALRMASDLERIGDMGKNIARRTAEIGETNHPKQVMRGLQHLTALALQQLKTVLDAYVNTDVKKAREVLDRDDEVDQVYTSLFRELLTYMMEDPRNIGFCTHLLFCAKNIERVGDHATNLAETVLFIVTGEAGPSDHGTRAQT